LKAAKGRPDLILTDIRMPGEDGLSLLSRLRDSGWKGQAVVISGYDDFGYAQQAIRLGVLDFLLKPVFSEDMARLLDKLAALLGAGATGVPTGLSRGGEGETAGSREGRLPEPVRRAMAFVDLRYDSHFTVEEAAGAACVSPAWLSATFKRSLGLSVMEYARLKRAEKARELLAGSDAPLKEIADSLAFPDLPTFSKLFRKVVGTSPGAYRKAHRGAGGPSGGEE
jgi:YesN/AraC family two-component response regulator